MIFIRGNVPSLKNSKIKGIYHPKTVTKYLRSLNIQGYSASKKTVKEYKDPNRPNLFRQQIGTFFNGVEYPIVLGFHFVRDSKRRFDHINAMHVVLDLLTAHDYIPDDNCEYIIPAIFKLNGKTYTVDRINPGVYIKIYNHSLCIEEFI
jgi:hypothetical protein